MLSKEEFEKFLDILDKVSDDLDYYVDGYYGNLGHESVQKILNFLMELGIIPENTII